MIGLVFVVSALVLGGAGTVGAYEDYNNMLYPKYEIIADSEVAEDNCLKLPIECQVKLDATKPAFSEELEDC